MNWRPAGQKPTGLASALPGIPGLVDAFEAYRQALWSQPHVPAATLALCRARVAQLHRCSLPAGSPGGDITAQAQHRVESLSRWHEDPRFGAAERACLEFTEVYCADPNALTDAQADAIKHHFGECGLVALVQALGVFDAECRLALLLGAD